VSTEIERCELYVSDAEFFRGRVECWLEDGNAIVLKHVKESCFSGIVETEEKELCRLVSMEEPS
jgi:hypothetical protein